MAYIRAVERLVGSPVYFWLKYKLDMNGLKRVFGGYFSGICMRIHMWLNGWSPCETTSSAGTIFPNLVEALRDLWKKSHRMTPEPVKRFTIDG